MAKSTDKDSTVSRKRKPKNDATPESREKEMIALAMNAVEERMRTGKASSAEYVHFLRLGTERTKLEREKLENENQLLRAKTESLQQQKEIGTMFEEAIKAMTRYQGNPNDEEDEY